MYQLYSRIRGYTCMHETGAAGLTKGVRIISFALLCTVCARQSSQIYFRAGITTFMFFLLFRCSFCPNLFLSLSLSPFLSLSLSLLSFIDVSRFGEKRLPKAIILYRGNVHPFLFRCSQRCLLDVPSSPSANFVEFHDRISFVFGC